MYVANVGYVIYKKINTEKNVTFHVVRIHLMKIKLLGGERK